MHRGNLVARKRAAAGILRSGLFGNTIEAPDDQLAAFQLFTCILPAERIQFLYDLKFRREAITGRAAAPSGKMSEANVFMPL